jgi:hypothetical protein
VTDATPLTAVTFDDLGWHRFTTTRDGRTFIVDVSARAAPSADDALQLATSTYRRVVAEAWELTAQGAVDLLAIYNDEWARGDILDETSFRRRLRLQGLAIMPDGTARVEFDDGGLFRGHDVVVEATPDLRPVEAFLEG